MDAMYLNLMFINPRPPVGDPPPAKIPGSAPEHCYNSIYT